MKVAQFFYDHPVFNYQEFAAWKKKQDTVSDTALHMALRYYVLQGRLLRLRRELYAVVPPNLTPSELRVDPYLIAAKVSPDSVLAYHTALELYGLAYSSFEQFTFLTKRKVKPFDIAGQWYQPVAVPSVLSKGKNSMFGVETISRQGLDIKITGISRTFVDILDRIDLSGGLEEVSRSLENIAVLNIEMIIKYCLMLRNARLAAKVGYFLEQRQGAFAVTEQQLQPLLAIKPRSPQYLAQELRKDCRLVKKWNLMIPEYLLKKSWEEQNHVAV